MVAALHVYHGSIRPREFVTFCYVAGWLGSHSHVRCYLGTVMPRSLHKPSCRINRLPMTSLMRFGGWQELEVLRCNYVQRGAEKSRGYSHQTSLSTYAIPVPVVVDCLRTCLHEKRPYCLMRLSKASMMYPLVLRSVITRLGSKVLMPKRHQFQANVVQSVVSSTQLTYD